MRSETRQYIRLLSLVSTMGLSMGLAVVIGLAIGYYLDHRVFHTEPWLTLIFMIIGVVAGFRNLFIIARMAQRMEKEKNG